MKNYSDLQIRAIQDLQPHAGETVQVCTSQYTHQSNGVASYPNSFKPVTVLTPSTLRSLVVRGIVEMEQDYWRGATIRVPHSIIKAL